MGEKIADWERGGEEGGVTICSIDKSILHIVSRPPLGRSGNCSKMAEKRGSGQCGGSGSVPAREGEEFIMV
jgi:hypothetical protein